MPSPPICQIRGEEPATAACPVDLLITLPSTRFSPSGKCQYVEPLSSHLSHFHCTYIVGKLRAGCGRPQDVRPNVPDMRIMPAEMKAPLFGSEMHCRHHSPLKACVSASPRRDCLFKKRCIRTDGPSSIYQAIWPQVGSRRRKYGLLRRMRDCLRRVSLEV